MLINWNELSQLEFEQYREKAAVVVNFASTEQHSYHLPVGTDAFLGKEVTEQAAALAKTPIILLPQVCYGYSPHHRFAPGYITMPQKDLVNYACDICECVRENGFQRMYLVNSHGGNQVYLSAVINEMGEKHGTSFALKELRYWDVAGPRISEIRESKLGGMGHAGEFETSIMMYLHPELVHKELIHECDPVPGDPWFQRDLLGYKKYQKYANFNEVNPEGHIGQPHLASSEKGKLLFEAVTEELAKFFDYFNR
jgi:creatinine amidohydrolase